MINIVQAFFRNGWPCCNTVTWCRTIRIALCLAALPLLQPSDALARRAAGPAYPCEPPYCPGRRPPGPPDRDARPFDGTLGRPCAYRQRYTPSGTRRVRVCF